MHVADIVCIDNLTIHTNRSLLSPLHMQNKSSIFGLYYPSSHTITDEHYMFEHDFMFTPIPPSLWHSIARFVVLLKHEPGCIAGLTNHLKDKSVNIITAESTRAGHRFMYFTLTLEFEELSDTDEKNIFTHLTGKELTKKQSELKKRIINLKKSILADCKDYLFQSKHGIEPFGIVEGHIVHSLQYFYYKVGEYGYSDTYKPFMATIDQSKIVFEKNNWKQLWHNLLEKELPTYGFATSSTRDLCLRVCLLDKNKLHDFKSFKFNYKMSPNSNLMSSKGLIGFITESLKQHKYNIWSIYNSPTYNKTINGDGSINVIAQHISKSKRNTDISSKANDHLENILSKFKSNELSNNIILNGRVSLIARCPVFVSVRSKDIDKEHYKSLFYKAGLEIGLLEDDFVFFDSSKAAEDISGAVINTLKSCTVMIQIHNISPNKNDISVWLEAECLLARALDKPYRVLIHEDVKASLDIAIESDHTVFNSKLKLPDVRSALHDVIIKKFGSIKNMWMGG